MDAYMSEIVAVIDETTLAKTVSFRSGAAWWTHRYDVKPGVMLKQMADAELPQMFTRYEVANAYRAPSDGKGITLVLSVPRYAFRGFHAIATVRACSAVPDALRYAQFSSTSSTWSPSRSNRATCVAPLDPRSIPIGFEN